MRTEPCIRYKARVEFYRITLVAFSFYFPLFFSSGYEILPYPLVETMKDIEEGEEDAKETPAARFLQCILSTSINCLR